MPSAVLEARPVLSADGVAPGGDIRLAVACDVAAGWHVNSHEPTLDYLIPTQLVIEDVDDLEIGEVIYPAGKEITLAFSDTPLSVYDGRFLLGVTIRGASHARPGERVLRGRVKYQACNNSRCLAPTEANFSVVIPVVGFGAPLKLNESELFARIAFPASVSVSTGEDLRPADPPQDGGAGKIERLLDDWGLLLGLAAIFMWGLALNLTPCVYPLIPITVSFFAGQSENRSIAKSFSLAVVYVLGIAVTYSAFGVAAASSGGLFGSALQSPWVLGFVALVLAALALSSFGLYEIRPPSFVMNRIGGGRKGYLGAAFMGLTVGIVAAPCVGPVVVGLLLYVGKTGDPVLGFWMFFVLALGLGLPYLLLGTFSGSIGRLPRSGAWMLWVKKVFGVILLGMAVYFLQPILPRSVFVAALSVLLIGGGLYLGVLERTPQKTWRFAILKRGVGLVFLAGAVLVLLSKGPVASPGWQAYEDGLIARAERQRKPAIIDFYADWCIPCKELDANTFSDPMVIEQTTGFVKLKADLTRSQSPGVQALVKRYGIVGVPTVVFLDSAGKERTDLRVVQYVPPSDFLERVHRLQSSTEGPPAP